MIRFSRQDGAALEAGQLTQIFKAMREIAGPTCPQAWLFTVPQGSAGFQVIDETLPGGVMPLAGTPFDLMPIGAPNAERGKATLILKQGGTDLHLYADVPFTSALKERLAEMPGLCIGDF